MIELTMPSMYRLLTFAAIHKKKAFHRGMIHYLTTEQLPDPSHDYQFWLGACAMKEILDDQYDANFEEEILNKPYILNKPGTICLTDELLESIAKLYDQGYGIRDIGKQLNLGYRSIYNWIQKGKQEYLGERPETIRCRLYLETFGKKEKGMKKIIPSCRSQKFGAPN